MSASQVRLKLFMHFEGRCVKPITLRNIMRVGDLYQSREDVQVFVSASICRTNK